MSFFSGGWLAPRFDFSHFWFYFQVLFPLLSPRSGLLFSPPPHSSCGCFLLILGIWFTLKRSFLESKELNNTDCAVTRGWVGLVYKEAYLWKELLSPLPPSILEVLPLFSLSTSLLFSFTVLTTNHIFACSLLVCSLSTLEVPQYRVMSSIQLHVSRHSRLGLNEVTYFFLEKISMLKWYARFRL